MGPFIKIKNTTTKMMVNVIIALIPIILFSFYKNGIIPYQNGYTDLFGMFYPLVFILISTLSTLIIETIYSLIFNKDKKSIKQIITSSYAFMPGLFLGLILPINTPISILLVGSFFASIIGKMLFGGFGQNVFNPALIGRLFIISTYALVITEAGGYLNSYEIDAVSGATPLSNLSLINGIGSYETVIAPYGSLWDFFIGTIPGAIGETSFLLCIIGFLYLTITKTIKWRIPVFYITTVFIMTLVIGLLNGTGLWYPLFQIMSGGLAFGAIFMATDPVTSPVTSRGQILYGLCLGLLTVILRYLTPYPEGVLTSIITMNMLVFIIDKMGVKSNFNIKHFLIPLSVIIILIIIMTYVISNKLNTSDEVDQNYEILTVENINNDYIYTVTQQGYSSKLKFEITINNGIITKAEVLSSDDSFFSRIIDSKYIDKLISEQEILSNVDTVSGVTISSTAVKKAFINTLNNYNNKGYSEYIGKEIEEEDTNFKINSVTPSNDSYIYNVNQTSFGGSMNLEITISLDKVVDIKFINYSDTCISSDKASEFYTCPEYMIDSYIYEVIENNEIDTVSGATISSNAIKIAINNVLKDYEVNYEK